MATRDELKARIRAAATSAVESGPSPREILMQRIAAARVPPIPEPQGIPEEFGLERTARGAAQLGAAGLEGATLGFAPEVGALGSTVAGQMGMEGFSPEYAENLARGEQMMADIPTGTRAAGNLLGGTAVGLAAPLGAPRTVMQAAGQGALAGGASGAGFAEGGLPERAMGAAVGAGAGAGLGAAGQGAIQAVGGLISRLRQGVTGPTARAMDQILSDLDSGRVTLDQAVARLQRLGPEGMLADIPELQRLAQFAASKTTTGSRIAESAIRSRAARATSRIDNVLDIAFEAPVPGGIGPRLPVRQVRQNLLNAQKYNATPLYDAALSVGPLRRTRALTKLIGGIEEGGTNLAKLQGGAEKGSSLVKSAIKNIRASNPRFRGLPDTDPRLLHAARVQLAERSVGQGAPKRNINDVVQQLTDAMDDAGATGYRDAVNKYRSDSLMLEAFDRGRKAVNELPEDIENFLRSVPEGERQAFVVGLGRQLIRDLESGLTGNAASNVRRIFRGERAQVLREALGKKGFEAFRGRLMREIRFSETGQRVLGGSPTQPRQAGMREQAERAGRVVRAAGALREGRGPIAAGMEIARAAALAGPRTAQERALAQILFRSQGQGLGPGRFGPGQTPLTELLMRESLKRGANRLLAPARAPAAIAPAVAAGSALSGVEF